jgi:hypothetical protein
VGRATWRESGEQKSTDIQQKMVTLIYPYLSFSTIYPDIRLNLDQSQGQKKKLQLAVINNPF